MSMPHGVNAYRRIEADSRSPLELVVMLYDGAIRFLGEARDADARGDAGARSRAISRALAIITQLQTTLNLQQGGAVAAELDRLYTYVSERLLDVTMRRDASGIHEAHKLLSTLRESWGQIAGQP